MADVLTEEQRRKCMTSIRSGGTGPELTVRRLLHSLGYRYRLHVKSLPGKPDLVFTSRRTVIFVHGCFWHQHTCNDGHIPASRQSYWRPKLEKNVERDRQHTAALSSLGWKVLTVWECETKASEKLISDLLALLG